MTKGILWAFARKGNSLGSKVELTRNNIVLGVLKGFDLVIKRNEVTTPHWTIAADHVAAVPDRAHREAVILRRNYSLVAHAECHPRWAVLFHSERKFYFLRHSFASQRAVKESELVRVSCATALDDLRSHKSHVHVLKRRRKTCFQALVSPDPALAFRVLQHLELVSERLVYFLVKCKKVFSDLLGCGRDIILDDLSLKNFSILVIWANCEQARNRTLHVL